MIDIANAINSINPNAEFVIKGNNINTCEIEWLNETTPISKDEIKTKMAELPSAEEIITARDNKKASAKQKLQDLGLTTDEIKEAFGI